LLTGSSIASTPIQGANGERALVTVMATKEIEQLEAREDIGTRFLREVAARVALPPHIAPEAAVKAVMAAVTERLTRGAACTLLHALPTPIATLFSAHVARRTTPASTIHRPELIARIAGELGVIPVEAEHICRAVIGAIRELLPADVAEHVSSQLPADLQDVWYSTRPTHQASASSDGGSVTDSLVAIGTAIGVPSAGDAGCAAFAAVIGALSQRLSGGEARHLLVTLPSTLRALVEPWIAGRGELAEVFGYEELVTRVSKALAVDPRMGERAVRAVLDQAKRWLPVTEIEDVASQLPADLKAVWLAA
jgi:uncharacterized protein (DUF2267 family)